MKKKRKGVQGDTEREKDDGKHPKRPKKKISKTDNQL